MVRKSLLDIVTQSGIRKELLLFLNDGPRSLAEIRERFDITSPEVSPRIKELLENDLVKFENKQYKMTPMGKVVIKNFLPFYNTVNCLDSNIEWWIEHDLISIPEELRNRIGEIKNYFIIEDEESNVDLTRDEFIDIINRSEDICGVSSIFSEIIPETILNAIRNNKSISIVIPNMIYLKIKNEYQVEINEFINYEKAQFYVLDDEIKLSHLVTDDCLYVTLNYKNGKTDMNTNLVSNDASSVNWGKDLFEYYRNKAKLINAI